MTQPATAESFDERRAREQRERAARWRELRGYLGPVAAAMGKDWSVYPDAITDDGNNAADPEDNHGNGWARYHVHFELRRADGFKVSLDEGWNGPKGRVGFSGWWPYELHDFRPYRVPKHEGSAAVEVLAKHPERVARAILTKAVEPLTEPIAEARAQKAENLSAQDAANAILARFEAFGFQGWSRGGATDTTRHARLYEDGLHIEAEISGKRIKLTLDDLNADDAAEIVRARIARAKP